MLKLFKKFISICEISPTDVAKKREYRSLSELVTILFAVIFGVGLSQLGELKSGYDFGVLLVGYLAVTLSWWGYNWGIIAQPETNILNYVIDIILIAIYWWLINLRNPQWIVVLGYFIMFGLYWLWEIVRKYSQRSSLNKGIINKAIKLNLTFFALTGVLFSFKRWWLNPFSDSYICLASLFLLVVCYRACIYRIYHPKSKRTVPSIKGVKDLDEILVSKAREVAANAKVHLSGFRVGAAIVSDTGNVYSGCNVEFDNYSNTIHAEESAISAFVAAGEKNAMAIAVFTFGNDVSFPCGMCRQSLFELGGKNMRVVACNQYKCESKTIDELLPAGFKL
jgi:cytidine deaminase